jgi:hypothetical protein
MLVRRVKIMSFKNFNKRIQLKFSVEQSSSYKADSL